MAAPLHRDMAREKVAPSRFMYVNFQCCALFFSFFGIPFLHSLSPRFPCFVICILYHRILHTYIYKWVISGQTDIVINQYVWQRQLNRSGIQAEPKQKAVSSLGPNFIAFSFIVLLTGSSSKPLHVPRCLCLSGVQAVCLRQNRFKLPDVYFVFTASVTWSSLRRVDNPRVHLCVFSCQCTFLWPMHTPLPLSWVCHKPDIHQTRITFRSACFVFLYFLFLSVWHHANLASQRIGIAGDSTRRVLCVSTVC